jgi:hypothetical protein
VQDHLDQKKTDSQDLLGRGGLSVSVDLGVLAALVVGVAVVWLLFI